MTRLFGVDIVLKTPRYRDVPVRTHRKRRIAKKWLKRYGTKPLPEYDWDPETFLRVGDTVYAYEPAYSKLRKELEKDAAIRRGVGRLVERVVGPPPPVPLAAPLVRAVSAAEMRAIYGHIDSVVIRPRGGGRTDMARQLMTGTDWGLGDEAVTVTFDEAGSVAAETRRSGMGRWQRMPPRPVVTPELDERFQREIEAELDRVTDRIVDRIMLDAQDSMISRSHRDDAIRYAFGGLGVSDDWIATRSEPELALLDNLANVVDNRTPDYSRIDTNPSPERVGHCLSLMRDLMERMPPPPSDGVIRFPMALTVDTLPPDPNAWATPFRDDPDPLYIGCPEIRTGDRYPSANGVYCSVQEAIYLEGQGKRVEIRWTPQPEDEAFLARLRRREQAKWARNRGRDGWTSDTRRREIERMRAEARERDGG